MKTITLISFLALSFLLPTAAEDDPNDLWLDLSVEAQNLSYAYIRLQPGGAVDPESLSRDMKPVEEALIKLTEVGALSEKTIRLAPWSQLGQNGSMQLQKFTEKLAEDFGHFTALFLLDLGPSRRFEDEQSPNTPVNLRVRSQEKWMEEFEEMVAQHKLLKRE